MLLDTDMVKILKLHLTQCYYSQEFEPLANLFIFHLHTGHLVDTSWDSALGQTVKTSPPAFTMCGHDPKTPLFRHQFHRSSLFRARVHYYVTRVSWRPEKLPAGLSATATSG